MSSKNLGFGDMQARIASGGLLRVTTAERNALTVDADAIALNRITAGYQVYNTTTNKINFWNGAAWEVVTSA